VFLKKAQPEFASMDESLMLHVGGFRSFIFDRIMIMVRGTSLNSSDVLIEQGDIIETLKKALSNTRNIQLIPNLMQ